MKTNKDYAIFKLVGLLFSHKFMVLLLVVLASFGLRLDAEVHAAILVVAGVTFSLLKYLEDKARLGQSISWEELLDKLSDLIESLPGEDDGEETPK